MKMQHPGPIPMNFLALHIQSKKTLRRGDSTIFPVKWKVMQIACKKFVIPGFMYDFPDHEGFWMCGYLSPPGNRNDPSGTLISNRAPFPQVPFSLICIPVMERISLVRNSPSPDPLPNPLWKIVPFSSGGIPTPSSSTYQVSPPEPVEYLNLT